MTHYYSEKQTSAKRLKKITIRVEDMQYELYSASGVFSKDKLDRGSRLLIENARIQEGWSVLDMGCGIGVVGISVKMLHPSTEVVMVDVNERAVEISQKNVHLHKLDIETKKSDIYSTVNRKFDTILVNPPQTAGKDVCFAIIEGAKERLKPGGCLQLVARHKKGGRSLEEKMQEVFGKVEYAAKGGGYRIYISWN